MSSSCSPPLFFPSISPSSRRLCILSSRHLFFFFSFFPFFSSSPSLSLNSYILPLSVSLSLPLPSVYFFHHPVERNSEKERRWGGGGRRAQTGRGIKELRRGKRQSPFVTDEAFIEKRGSFSQFPVDILCSLFFPCCPSPSFCPNNPPPPRPPLLPVRLRRCGRLFGINKDGCWQMRSRGVGRWLAKHSIRFTQITACVPPTRDGYIPRQTIKNSCKNGLQGEAWRRLHEYTYGVFWQADRVDGIWTAWRQKEDKEKNEGRGLMTGVDNEQVLWSSEKQVKPWKWGKTERWCCWK